MVNTGIQIKLMDFQEMAVIKLLDFLENPTSKQTITVKSPTGSGKTIFLIGLIEEYLTSVTDNVAFIWLCPGKGDLEDQSRDKMRKFAPHLMTQSLFDALTAGFQYGTTTFINWELVTKSGNNAIKDSEKKNLFDRIAEAHRDGIRFIIIIDEEHSNNTAKAKTIIDAFAAKHIIRVSATADLKNSLNEHYEIDEADVINAGLITKAISVNEGVKDNMQIGADYDTLLELADEKRKAIFKRYSELEKKIRPLVLIQFPNGRPETILAVERKLEQMGYTYDNGMVSKWMSEDKKDLPDNLTENGGIPVFLLMKQAISTGWDCPRAKILVKLREGMSETFEIQTIGRIRRMPEAVHYDDDLLDFCYVYTFDETYKNGLLSAEEMAYETRRLFLKDKCKTFTLEKQIRDLDFSGIGAMDVLREIYKYLVDKYHLSGVKSDNQRLLAENNYKFGNEILGNAPYGEYVHAENLMGTGRFVSTRMRVNTHTHGMQLLHCVDEIKRGIGLPTDQVKIILERLFRKSAKANHQKLLNLSTDEFYAFVINNVHLINRDFKEVMSQTAIQEKLGKTPNPKKSKFSIPEQDFLKYDPTVKGEVEYLSNAYEDYTSGFATTRVRSLCEVLFEEYCEKKEDIDWVYKNGDSGQQYFSIVYLNHVKKQWLFYADYIVKKKDGSTWIIETKGGEMHGQDMNIDPQVANKFAAFKKYAEEQKTKGVELNWGFVRYKDNKLYLDNTEYNEDIQNENWVPIADKF